MTPLMRKVLHFISREIGKNGVAPTLQEITDATELHSKSQAHEIIGALESRGFIKRTPGASRGIELLHLPITSQLEDAIAIVEAAGLKVFRVNREEIQGEVGRETTAEYREVLAATERIMQLPEGEKP